MSVYIKSFYVLVLLVCMASLSVSAFAVWHMEGCPNTANTGECFCHLVNPGQNQPMVEGATGYTGAEADDGRVHFPDCPRYGACDCPLKKDLRSGPDGQYMQQVIIPAGRDVGQSVPKQDDRAFEALKLLLQTENPEKFQKSKACELVVSGLSGRQLAPDNVNQLLIGMLEQNGYQCIQSWEGEKLVSGIPDIAMESLVGFRRVMDEVSQTLRMKGLSPTRKRDEYKVGTTLCMLLQNVKSNMFFFIDILETLDAEEKKTHYVLSFHYSPTPIVFNTWAKLNLYIDTFLVTFFVHRIDLYLFKQPACS